MNKNPQAITIPQESWKHLFTIFDTLKQATDSKTIQVKKGKVSIINKDSTEFDFDWKKLQDIFLDHLDKRRSIPLEYDVKYYNDFIKATNAAYYLITDKKDGDRHDKEKEFIDWHRHHFIST